MAPPSPLLGLPTELLNEICRLVIADPPRTITTYNNRVLNREVQPAISKVCRTTRQLAIPIFYGQNIFRVVINIGRSSHVFTKNTPTLGWLHALDPATRALVRNVNINITPWSYHDGMSMMQLAIFLVAHGVHVSSIRNMDQITRKFRDFKDHMVYAASISPSMRDPFCFA